MEDLIKALDSEDGEKINELACDLFITNGGGCDWKKIKEFESMASCRIFPVERDSFGWLVGGIFYKGKTWTYG